MRRTDNLVNNGSHAIDRNQKMGLSAAEVMEMKEAAAGDVYLFGEKMFYAGIAIGMRIAEKERRSND